MLLAPGLQLPEQVLALLLDLVFDLVDVSPGMPSAGFEPADLLHGRLLARHGLDIEIHSVTSRIELEAGYGAHAVSSSSARVVGMLTRVAPRFYERDDLPAEIYSLLSQATKGYTLTDAYLWIRKLDR